MFPDISYFRWQTTMFSTSCRGLDWQSECREVPFPNSRQMEDASQIRQPYPSHSCKILHQFSLDLDSHHQSFYCTFFFGYFTRVLCIQSSCNLPFKYLLKSWSHTLIWTFHFPSLIVQWSVYGESGSFSDFWIMQ